MTSCPQCGSTDTAPLLSSERTCHNCGAKFDGDRVVTEGTVPPAAEDRPGIIDIQNSEGVTVAYVDPVANEVHTSTTIDPETGDAVDAVDADPVARANRDAQILKAEEAEDAAPKKGKTVTVSEKTAASASSTTRRDKDEK